MNGRRPGTCFSDLEHNNGAAAQVDYSPTFATAPVNFCLEKEQVTPMQIAVRNEVAITLFFHSPSGRCYIKIGCEQ